MQRIDEDTYIDDTLVTCAEYQLFIDEMCAQGKYYQPDHWSSYQFPERKAKEPILGMRYSDAVMFCEWLIKREAGEWRYRLPKEEEAIDYLLPLHSDPLPLGHWIKSADDRTRFAWARDIPKNPRGIDIDRALQRGVDNFIDIFLGHSRANGFDLALGHALDRIRGQTLSGALKNTIDHALGNDQALGSDFERVDLSEAIFKRAINRALALDLDHVRIFDTALNFETATNLSRAFGIALDRGLDRSQAIHNDLPEAIRSSLNSVLDNDIYRYIDIALDLYIDTFTLQERIAGRSPAFEGIRLVKERIK